VGARDGWAEEGADAGELRQLGDQRAERGSLRAGMGGDIMENRGG